MVNNISAWGNTGHEIVAAIAEKQLTTTTKIAVKKLLNYPISSIASIWADAIKSDNYSYSNKGYYKNTHFINLPIQLNLTINNNLFSFDNKFNQTIKINNANIYNAINNYINILKNPTTSTEQKAITVRFLIHLVGDLQQPLHSSDPSISETTTHGGNSIYINNMVVKIPVISKQNSKRKYIRIKNLHALWDDMGGAVNLVKSPAYVKGSYKKQLTIINNYAEIIINNYKNQNIENINNTSVKQWVKDSYTVGVEAMYHKNLRLVKNGNKWEANLNDNYIKFVQNTSLKQIYIAGEHLGWLLNNIFDPIK